MVRLGNRLAAGKELVGDFLQEKGFVGFVGFVTKNSSNEKSTVLFICFDDFGRLSTS